jgi:hypothetical protein
MTYIYEMASGTEYLGEELGCPKQTAALTNGASHLTYGAYQVEPRLAVVENLPRKSASSSFPAGLDINGLINAIED